jgi:hypothetical protein
VAASGINRIQRQTAPPLLSGDLRDVNDREIRVVNIDERQSNEGGEDVAGEIRSALDTTGAVRSSADFQWHRGAIKFA